MRTDADIVQAVRSELQQELPYSSRFIDVQLEAGRVVLESNDEWRYTRPCVQAAMSRISELPGYCDRIGAAPRASSEQICQTIENALRDRDQGPSRNVVAVPAHGMPKRRGNIKAWADPKIPS
jgi:hypothetical protein